MIDAYNKISRKIKNELGKYIGVERYAYDCTNRHDFRDDTRDSGSDCLINPKNKCDKCKQFIAKISKLKKRIDIYEPLCDDPALEHDVETIKYMYCNECDMMKITNKDVIDIIRSKQKLPHEHRDKLHLFMTEK